MGMVRNGGERVSPKFGAEKRDVMVNRAGESAFRPRSYGSTKSAACRQLMGRQRVTGAGRSVT